MTTEVDFANAVKGKLDGKAPIGHDHDDRYYTETEADGRFVQGSDPRLTDARTPTAHSHPISGVTGLQTALDGKQAAGSYAAAGHTHTAAAVTDLTETVQDIVGALLVAGVNTTITYDDTAGTVTINSTASGGGGETDPEIVRDVIGGALVAGSGIQITVNDAADTITVASTAVQPTRAITAGTGLTGGGDLSADRELAVDFTAVATAAQGAKADSASQAGHAHDDRYYTEAEADGRFVRTVNGTSPDETGDVTVAGGSGADTATVNYHGAVLEGLGAIKRTTQLGNFNVPASAIPWPADLTIDGNVANTVDVASGVLNPVVITTITAKNAAGATAQEITYAPSLTLRSTPAVRDTLATDGTVTRRVGVAIFNGSESWAVRTVPKTNTLSFYRLLPNFKPANSAPGYSNRFPMGDRVLDDLEGVQLGISNTSVYVQINKSRLATTDVAGFRAWLAANPLTVYYPLETPTTETSPAPTVTISPGGTIATDSAVPARLAARFASRVDPYALAPGSSVIMFPPMPEAVIEPHQKLYDRYDALRAKNPGYITTSSLGVDAWGKHIREYVFSAGPASADGTSQYVFPKQKVGIMSGLHGNEQGSAYALHRVMTALAEVEGGNDLLRRMRSMFDFYVLPVGCPSSWDANTRNNTNNVDINRNFTTSWSAAEQFSGTGPASELETQIIEAWMVSRSLDWFFDCHGSDHSGSTLSLAVVAGGDVEPMTSMRKSYAKTMNTLSSVWARRYTAFPAATNFGRLPFYTTLAQSQTHAAALGIKSMLVEAAGPITYVDTSRLQSTTLTCNAEVVANTLLNVLSV